HEKGGRNPFAGDIADGKADAAIGRVKEVVEIAGHLLSGKDAAKNIERFVAASFEVVRQEAFLNFARQGQFAHEPLFFHALGVQRGVFQDDGDLRSDGGQEL